MNLFVHQVRSEQLLFWRSREAAIFVFLFPVMLLLLLGAVYDGEIDGHPASSWLLVGMIGYGVANTALGGLAITLVIRRESGLLKRLRSTPLPGSLYLTTVLLSNLLIVVLQSLTVIALGLLLFDADVPQQTLQFVVSLVIGAACFAGLGLAAAALIRSADAVAAVVNVIVLPMSFLSGAFGTTDNLPPVLELVADVLPLKYLIELVLATYVDGDPISNHLGAIGVLAAWGAGGYLVARTRFGWEPRER